VYPRAIGSWFMGYDSVAADDAGFRCCAVACSRRAATLLWLTGDDILVQRGAARATDERALNVGRRESARRENIVASQLPGVWRAVRAQRKTQSKAKKFSG
jgi:hypothetical protein